MRNCPGRAVDHPPHGPKMFAEPAPHEFERSWDIDREKLSFYVDMILEIKREFGCTNCCESMRSIFWSAACAAAKREWKERQLEVLRSSGLRLSILTVIEGHVDWGDLFVQEMAMSEYDARVSIHEGARFFKDMFRCDTAHPDTFMLVLLDFGRLMVAHRKEKRHAEKEERKRAKAVHKGHKFHERAPPPHHPKFVEQGRSSPQYPRDDAAAAPRKHWMEQATQAYPSWPGYSVPPHFQPHPMHSSAGPPPYVRRPKPLPKLPRYGASPIPVTHAEGNVPASRV